MFLSKDYFLSSELFLLANISIANSSMLAKSIEDKGISDAMQKMGNCIFFNSKSKYIPNNILNYYLGYKEKLHTFEDKVPISFLRTEFEKVGYTAFKNGFKANGYELKEVKIGGKNFCVFPENLLKIIKDKTLYILDENEYKDCLKNNTIEGGLKLKKDIYFVWY